MSEGKKRERGWTIEEVKQYLSQKGIKPSVYRLKIFHYLITRKTHPTAEEIFNHLKKEIPSVCRATVYNTVRLFEDKKIIQSIQIEKNEARFDATVARHGHFRCSSCGKIFDVDLDDLKIKGLEGFAIENWHLHLEGRCRRCQEKLSSGKLGLGKRGKKEGKEPERKINQRE
jgi:Fur family peroxide stress response transcriptional regulator